MSYEVVWFDQEETYIRQFLDLPSYLYRPDEMMQNYREEKAFLQGTHALSKSVSLVKLLVVDQDSSRAVARAVLTIYPDDEVLYLGYFECIQDQQAAMCLFDAVKQWAKEHRFRRIVGPVNVSFWVGYRLKMNEFGVGYTGEPYNKEYYAEMFDQAGFVVSDWYKSNRFGVIEKSFSNARYVRRLEETLKAGYQIVSPRRKDFDAVLRSIYHLIVQLYRNFPVFKMIDEQTFMSQYGYLKYILDYRMVKLVYRETEMIGFFISIPNYGNCFYGKSSLRKWGRALKIRCRPTDYVMLYMGVLPEYRGIGRALAESMLRELKHTRAKSVGALIHQGKVTGGYFSELVEQEYWYALFTYELEGEAES